MRDFSQVRIASSLSLGALVFSVILGSGLVASAQVHGIPPSVTSIQNHVYPYLPNAPASVTSLGPYGYGPSKPWNTPPIWYTPNRPHGPGHRPGNGGRYGGYGYGYAVGAAVPYYYLYPPDDYADPGSDGPYMSSGPPQGGPAPADQMPRYIVEQGPSRPEPPREQADVAPPAAQIPEPQPGVPTILVFRDGRHQSVSNYAIMGQTVYVFGDNRTRKIAFSELDLPATVKANDEEGVEFKVPADSASPKKPGIGAPSRQSTPLPSPPDPNNLTTSLLP